MKRILFFIAIFAIPVFATEESFPYGQPSTDIQIKFKEHTTFVEERSTFIISAGEVEGEAVLTTAKSKRDGESMVDSLMFGVKSNFQNSVAPYPGHITNSIVCHTKKYVKDKTVDFQGRQTKLLLAVAVDRHIFGGCAIDEIKYASAVWAAYDEKRGQVLTVRLFKQISNPNTIHESQEKILRTFQKIIQ